MGYGIHLHTYPDPQNAPTAHLNPASLEAGRVLVTVDLGTPGGSYLSFSAPEDVTPLIEALTRARELTEDGARQLAAAQAVAEAAQDD